MPLKRADHHHEPTLTHWLDGREGVLFTMEDVVARGDPVRCFVVRTILSGLRGQVEGDLLAVFHARRDYLEAAAQRAYDTQGQPIEIVLDEESYPQLRKGLVIT